MKQFVKAAMLAVVVLLAGAVSSEAAIRLVYAGPIQGSVGGVSFSYSDIYVHVESTTSLGSWSAAIHYDGGPLGTWVDAPMTMVGHYGTHMLFYVRLPVSTARFAIRTTWSYSVSGMSYSQDYWDNNGGRDYTIRVHGGSTDGIVGGNVGLVTIRNYARAVSWGIPRLYDQYVEGSIAVQRTSSRRAAGVRLTTNNWRTFTDVPISSETTLGYGYGSSQILLCTFSHRVARRVLKPNLTVKFAVYYRDEATGAIYWDNNFGQDYTVKAGETVR